MGGFKNSFIMIKHSKSINVTNSGKNSGYWSNFEKSENLGVVGIILLISRNTRLVLSSKLAPLEFPSFCGILKKRYLSVLFLFCLFAH